MTRNDMTPTHKRIGELNGPWAVLLRVMLATYPPLLAGLLGWGSWVSREVILATDFRTRSEARIAQLEASRNTDNIQTARIEVLLEEIKTKLNQFEKAHQP